MPKASPVTVYRPDGSIEVLPASHFEKFTYARYRQSKKWKALRDQVRKRAGFKCQGCGATAQEKLLEVHHKTYERLGDERLEDLVLMCQRCHATEHQWKRRLGRDLTHRG